MKIYLLYPTNEQEDIISSFLETNKIYPYEYKEELPPHVIASIERGQTDINAGRSITLEELKKIRLFNVILKPSS